MGKLVSWDRRYQVCKPGRHITPSLPVLWHRFEDLQAVPKALQKVNPPDISKEK
jgi:hypothetical protein